MSLYLGLLWMACVVICLGVFVLCRKRVADIAHQVAEETEHQARRILKAERAIEERLCEDFVGFDNPVEALQKYKSAQAGIEGIPRCNPAWKWTAEDLEQARKLTQARETARRCRSPVVTSTIAVLTLTLAAAVATVILSNSVQPVLAAQTPPVFTTTSSNTLPSPAYLPTLGGPGPAPMPPISPASIPALSADDPAANPIGSSASVPASPLGDAK